MLVSQVIGPLIATNGKMILINDFKITTATISNFIFRLSSVLPPYILFYAISNAVPDIPCCNNIPSHNVRTSSSFQLFHRQYKR